MNIYVGIAIMSLRFFNLFRMSPFAYVNLVEKKRFKKRYLELLLLSKEGAGTKTTMG